ncbi:MAG: prepilin-type N-terminal cleavage/methylation domain-containing protein [Phycisphaerae bacterium]|nr:prepilin-type N-terminal cleavage/methylation domain-containing protein [Phycisphaerae bacterium]
MIIKLRHTGLIRQAHSGLTLMEILVAIMIIAILAAGLYSVSNYVEKQAQAKLTESTIEILSAAIEQYHDFYGKFPDITVASDYPANCDGIERLYYKLSLAPDAKNILNQINSSMIKNVDKNELPQIYLEIVDIWGTDFRYSYNSGDNFPLIESAGPDKNFNTPADNISSK